MLVHHQLGVFLLASAVTAGSAPARAAQAPATDTTPRKPAGKVFTLTGCVSTDAATSGQVLLSDATGRATYRLSGTDVREYLGRRVQIQGAPSRRVQIVGGLFPSPNAAAQAGALDPAQAAMAATGSGARATPLPQFRVRSVQVVAGSCPQR